MRLDEFDTENDREIAAMKFCIRLTFSGMTLPMIRLAMQKRLVELLLRNDPEANLSLKVGMEKVDE